MLPDVFVTVILAVHNGADLIPRALDSIAHQTRPPEEVIIVDDGSTDDLVRVLEQGPYEPRLIRQDRGGQGSALNAGIAAASGDVLAFLDHDDMWLPDKNERQLSLLDLTGSDAVVGATVNRITRNDGSWDDQMMGPARVLGASLLRRETIDCVGVFPTDGRIHEIIDWWSRADGRITIEWDVVPALIRHIHGRNQTLRPEHLSRSDLMARIRDHRHRMSASRNGRER